VGQVVTFPEPRAVVLEEYADPPLDRGEVRLATLFSGISAGTELTQYRGSNPYLAKRWDGERRLFVDGPTSLAYPVRGVGYEEVGRVVEVGPEADGVREGDVVYGTWGHRSTHVVQAEWAAARTLPDGLDPVAGVFSRIGAIALNNVLDADIHVGEWVAIFGQGVPGLIATRLATLNGGSVIAVDALDARLDLARRMGAVEVVDVRAQDAGEVVKALTDGRGADVTIELSGVAAALHSAIRSTAYNSRVVASSFYQGGATALHLGEEFHHNRIEIVCSQISGLSRRLDHRWDLRRLERTFMRLQAEGRVDAEPLITHRFPVAEAAEAFALLDERPHEAVQVVLVFAAAEGAA
jgi:2-desacetyl-2-hydroxyethyl bacteriochlorophyllide A dehydrogenase